MSPIRRIPPQGAGHSAPRIGTARPRRRTALAGSLTLGALLAVTGCAASGSRGSSEAVSVWDLFSGADGANMRDMIATVSEELGGLPIDPTTLAWGNPYYTKLAMAASSEAPPDTAIMHVSRMPGFAPGGLLQEWDLDRLADVGLRSEDFTEALWQSCTYKDSLFAVPLDTHPFIAFYDPQIAEQAGVLNSNGTIEISSPEAMQEVGSKLAEVTGDHGIAFGYLLDTAQAWRLFWGFYHQAGGAYTIEPDRPVELDTAAAASVIAAVATWMDGTVMASDQDYPGALSAFNGGRAGMILSGEWEFSGFLDAKGEGAFDAMPMPTIFGTPANYADSHAYVLPRRRDGDDEHLQHTYEFVAGLLGQGGQWGVAGHIPAYLPAQDTDEYRALEVQQHYAAAAETVVFDPPVWFAGAGTDFQNRMSQVLIEGFRGAVEPERAADQLVSTLESFVASPNPTA